MEHWPTISRSDKLSLCFSHEPCATEGISRTTHTYYKAGLFSYPLGAFRIQPHHINGADIHLPHDRVKCLHRVPGTLSVQCTRPAVRPIVRSDTHVKELAVQYEDGKYVVRVWR